METKYRVRGDSAVVLTPSLIWIFALLKPILCVRFLLIIRREVEELG